MTFWKSPDFKALQEYWYRLLESQGFQDAEMTRGDRHVLKQDSEHLYRTNKDPLRRENKETYYRMLSQRVHEAEYKRDIDRLIMTWYAECKEIASICEELERMGQRRCRTSIRYIIRKYEMAWGIRKYTRRQLHLKEK